MPITDNDENFTSPPSMGELSIFLIIFIIYLIWMTFSLKGIYQRSCKYNYSGFEHIIAQVFNNLLLGIPGIYNAVVLRNTKFVKLS